MAEILKKMTWKEITEIYPDEWVLLDNYEPDIDFDGIGIIAKKGIVLVHSKSKKEFNEKIKHLTRTPESDTARRYYWRSDSS